MKHFLVFLWGCVSLTFAACGGLSLREQADLMERNAPVLQVSEANRVRFNELFLEAVRQKQKGNYDAQYELLTEALRLSPNSPEALYDLGLLSTAVAGWDDSLKRAEADSLLERAVMLDKENKYYKLTLAAHYAEAERFRDAILLCEEVLRQDPTSVEVLNMLVKFYEEVNDYAGAVNSLNRIERLLGSSEQIALAKFNLYAEMNDSARAFQSIEDLCEQYPNDLRYRVLLGDAYMQAGAEEMGTVIYQDVLTAEPDNEYAQYSLLNKYRAERNDSLYLDMLRRLVLNKQAEEHIQVEAMRVYVARNAQLKEDSVPVLRLFREALALRPSQSMAELCAGYMAWRDMPVDSLEPVMYHILSVAPDNNPARLQLLGIYIGRMDIPAVLRTCREGQLYDPSQVAYYYYEALGLLNEGKKKEALTAMNKGTARIEKGTDRTQASDLFAAKGDLLHELGQNAAAYLAYDSALVYEPENILVCNNYAYFLASDNVRLDYAERLSGRAVKAEPENGTYLDTYAWILFRQGKYAAAKEYIDKVLAISEEEPASAVLFDHAGDIYFRCGDLRAAILYWNKAQRLTKDKTARRRILQKIKRKRI